MADKAQSNGKWVNRFGTLVDITDRKTAKGDAYITFKLSAKGFDVYGSCFNADIIAQMKAAVGQRVWMNGVIDTMGEGENAKTSFKVIRFKLSDKQDDAPAAAEDTSNDEAAVKDNETEIPF